MSNPPKPAKRCAVYTRKSSEEGLEQSFNSLDAQREACAAYVQSQRHEGWRPVDGQYADGGYSGGSMDRPALQALLQDICTGDIDVVVVYKVDRLTRSLADFAKMVELFDRHGVSFVSVTQQFNTTTSMGRLTLNVLLSFAQFEREVTGERIRDKIAASKRKGLWMGGPVPLGYDLVGRALVRNEDEASLVQRIYKRYLALGCVRRLQSELQSENIISKIRLSRKGNRSGGVPYSRGALYSILQNRLYIGEIAHRGAIHQGQHPAVLSRELWDAVQDTLQRNSRARRIGLEARTPSLLTGLLFDTQGTRFTPLHSTKKGKRYRYYTSQAVIKSGAEHRGKAARIPAHDLEAVVSAQLQKFLRSEAQVLQAIASANDSGRRQQVLLHYARKASETLVSAALPELRTFLLLLAPKIVLHADKVVIHLQRTKILHALISRPRERANGTGENENDIDQQERSITLVANAVIRRLGGAVRLVIPEDGIPERAEVNEALVKAIARGRRWCEMLMSGEVPSVHQLAKRVGLDVRYVSRLLRCAFLSPDLVADILEGRAGKELSLLSIYQGIPPGWESQRKAFGRERFLAAEDYSVVDK